MQSARRRIRTMQSVRDWLLMILRKQMKAKKSSRPHATMQARRAVACTFSGVSPAVIDRKSGTTATGSTMTRTALSATTKCES